MLRSIIILLFTFGWITPAISADVVMRQIPNVKKVGEGQLSIAFWDIYAATLYAPNGQWNPQKPYALSILYFRDIEGKDIADRSVEEIKNQGFSDTARLEDWRNQMRDVFPNVTDGTELIALFIPNTKTIFYQNGTRIGVIKDPLFGQCFSDIWLSEKTSEPALRNALLGQP